MLVIPAASLLLIGAIVCTLQASANPSAPPPQPDTTFRLTEPVSGIAWLFFVNVLVDLFFYSGLLLAFAKKYVSISGIIKTSGTRFLVALVSAVCVIALIGAVVDFYIVAQPRFINGIYDSSGQNISGIYRVMFVDLKNWTVALTMIALSILACSFAFLKLRISMALLIAAGFVIINLAFWILISAFGEDVTYLTILLGVLSAPIVTRGLLHWYVVDRPLLSMSPPVLRG
jgi:hypothetical protein